MVAPETYVGEVRKAVVPLLSLGIVIGVSLYVTPEKTVVGKHVAASVLHDGIVQVLVQTELDRVPQLPMST